MYNTVVFGDIITAASQVRLCEGPSGGHRVIAERADGPRDRRTQHPPERHDGRARGPDEQHHRPRHRLRRVSDTSTSMSMAKLKRRSTPRPISQGASPALCLWHPALFIFQNLMNCIIVLDF